MLKSTNNGEYISLHTFKKNLVNMLRLVLLELVEDY
jgi:hypothetical protein